MEQKYGKFAKKIKKTVFFVRHIENRPIFAASNQYNFSNDNESCILVVAQTHDMTLWGAPLCSYIKYIIGLAGHNVLQALFLSSPIH
jgi:hypothetical protein